MNSEKKAKYLEGNRRMKSRIPVSIFFLILAVVIPNFGCDSPETNYIPADDIPNSYYSPGWAVGQWVRYDYSVSGTRSSIYIAITESEAVDGETHYWLEAVKTNGTTTVATRQLVAYSDNNPFLIVDGGILPDVKRYAIKTDYSLPTERPVPEGKVKPVINLERIFGGEKNIDTISVDENAAYVTKSGKDMVCVRKILMLNDENVGAVLVTRDVPITGIAYSSGRNRELELVDFGFSGAGTVF